MTFSILLALAPAFGAARPAFGQDELDLGIPDSVPWLDPEAGDAARAETKRVAAKHPLEELFPERLKRDLAAIDSWRAGLLRTLRFARTRTEVFPAAPVSRASLFPEYSETARASWTSAMDFWLALDSVRTRYAAYHVLADEDDRKAAFSAAYAAMLAQNRFVREWTELAARDPNLERLFDEPVPELGLPAGSYSRVRDDFSGAQGASRARAARSFERRSRTFAPLRGPLGRNFRAWTRVRRDDEKFLPKGASAALTRDGLSGTFPSISGARPAEGETLLRDEPPPNLLLPPLEGGEVRFSSQVVHGLDTIRHWFQMNPPEGGRPAVLISSAQIAGLALRLEPGDLLLARRERFLSEIGRPGFWHLAGIYAGTERERAKAFRGDFFNERLRAAAPRVYKSSLGQSGATELRPVVSAGPAGVRFEPLERFGSADHLAVLRPRKTADEKAAAVERAFSLIGKPFDPDRDLASEASCGEAELIFRAYAAGTSGGGLSPAEAEVNGLRTVTVNSIAMKFDRDFGTSRAELDLVAYLKAREERHDAVPATLEEFRRSWRRPKWVLRQETKK